MVVEYGGIEVQLKKATANERRRLHRLLSKDGQGVNEAIANIVSAMNSRILATQSRNGHKKWPSHVPTPNRVSAFARSRGI